MTNISKLRRRCYEIAVVNKQYVNFFEHYTICLLPDNAGDQHHSFLHYKELVMYRLDIPTKNEHNRLLEVWEASVRATHHFLKEEDIDFFHFGFKTISRSEDDGFGKPYPLLFIQRSS